MGEGLATFVVGCRCLCTKQTNPFTRSSAFQNSEQGWGGVRGEASRKPERREERRRRRKKKKKKEEENRTLTSKRNSLARTIRTKLRQFVGWSAEVDLPRLRTTLLRYFTPSTSSKLVLLVAPKRYSNTPRFEYNYLIEKLSVW